VRERCNVTGKPDLFSKLSKKDFIGVLPRYETKVGKRIY
jgi:hypothetical protein